MDRKTIIGAVILAAATAAATFFVTGALTSGQEVVEAGQDAQLKEVIREVLRDEMTVDIDGETKTYGQVLSSLHTSVTVMEAQMGVLIDD